MTSENVSVSSPRVNAIVSEVAAWHDAMADRGILSASVATQRKTALKQIVSVLGADEDFDLEALMKAVPELGNRWCRKHSANPNTARAYANRAANALDDYAAYQADPTSFRPTKAASSSAKSHPAAKPKQPKRDENQREVSAGGASTANPPQSMPAPQGVPRMRDCPLGNERLFQFVLPTDGLSFADVRRIANHLWTLSYDFDPSEPSAFDHATRLRDATRLPRTE